MKFDNLPALAAYVASCMFIYCKHAQVSTYIVMYMHLYIDFLFNLVSCSSKNVFSLCMIMRTSCAHYKLKANMLMCLVK